MINSEPKKPSLTTRELVLFSMLAGLMYGVRVALASLPNIELVSVLICSTTIVFRSKAFWPVYAYVFLEGLVGGFGVYWFPYLYIWPLLCVLVLQLPENSPPWKYMIVSALHGLLFSVLYAPFQVLISGLDFGAVIPWITTGLPYDLIHACSNFICGVLIVPLAKLMNKLWITGT